MRAKAYRASGVCVGGRNVRDQADQPRGNGRLEAGQGAEDHGELAVVGIEQQLGERVGVVRGEVRQDRRRREPGAVRPARSRGRLLPGAGSRAARRAAWPPASRCTDRGGPEGRSRSARRGTPPPRAGRRRRAPSCSPSRPASAMPARSRRSGLSCSFRSTSRQCWASADRSPWSRKAVPDHQESSGSPSRSAAEQPVRLATASTGSRPSRRGPSGASRSRWSSRISRSKGSAQRRSG